jgi:hypothetical protein
MLDLYIALTDTRLKWLKRAEQMLGKEIRELARRDRERERGTLAEAQRWAREHGGA